MNGLRMIEQKEARRRVIIRAIRVKNPLVKEGLMQFRGLIRAPEFPQGLEWINTPQPLQLQNLHGKIVLLEVWTHG